MLTTRAKIRSLLLWLGIFVSTILLFATVIFLFLESRWTRLEPVRSPQQAFLSGSIGTELIPLSVLEVLPELFPDKFPTGGNWVKKYGFIPPGWEKQLLKTQNDGGLKLAETNSLPLGFFVSRFRPLSADPSPVDFVGFTCATCHTTCIKKNAADPGVVVIGPGNYSLDLLAFLENLKAAVMQPETNSKTSGEPLYVLSPENVIARQIQMGRHPGALEQLVIKVWISQAREFTKLDYASNDEPHVGPELFDSRQNRAGPLRSNPFRSLVRALLDRPGRCAAQDDLDMGFVKFAAVFEQDGKEWAQFDGTVRNLYSRSALAAVSAGATIQSLSNPKILHNVAVATDYVKTLEGPRWETVFPTEAIDRSKAMRGLLVYRQYCSSCHGYRDLDHGKWLPETNPGISNRLGELIKTTEIKTDSERLTFAHSDRLPQAFCDYFGNLPEGLKEEFPHGHPFALSYDPNNPAKNDIRPPTGFINSPIPAAFLRVPFLHNASVLTMRELINLNPRRSSFYRGANYYDVVKVGLISSENAEPGREWKFDNSLRGNSNLGHDYPWPYSDHLSDEKRGQLEDLLEYTKTL